MNTANAEFVLHLPHDIGEMLRQAAQERQETLDQIVAESLRLSLTPLRQDALRRLRDQVKQQQTQPESETRANLEAGLAPEEQQRLSELLTYGQGRELMGEEQAERQRLHDRIEAVATRKAAALWLLSGRPSPADTSV